ncbi:MAG: hypothetical protein HY744_04765, partial [Deltaproteobacteria bacterium]|nr:hypothetical protein [Deltaproteobacteria bacterium]
GTGGGDGGVPTQPASCGGKPPYQCGDLADNDKDGLIDSQDPDCLGPCDNTEDSYFPDLPGMTGDPCSLDCFWDQGNGPGNDDCYWDHRCDPLEKAPDYPPEGIDCAYDPGAKPKPGMSCEDAFGGQSTKCLDYCAPLVPNGCDCFGCCELPSGSGKYVWLGSMDEAKNGTCTIDAVKDPAKCKPCTFVPGCGNACGKCELCIGKKPEDLPPECFDADAGLPDGGGGADGGEPGGQCPPGVEPCGLPGQQPCAAGYYCITGCCKLTPPK